MIEDLKACVVKSLSGRDAGRLFVVVNESPEYVYLADGRLRRVERPKKKKLKHVQLMYREQTRAAVKLKNGEKVSNSEIRRMLQEVLEAACT